MIDSDTLLSWGIGAISIAVVYFAFVLPATPVTAPPAAPLSPPPTTVQIHIGPATLRTDLFSIDLVTVAGTKEALAGSGPRASFALSKASDILVQGWALDGRDRKPASLVVGVVDDEFTIGAITIPRPDVVSAFHLTPDTISGFRLSVPTGGLASGRHRIHFLVIGADGSDLDTASYIEFVLKRDSRVLHPAVK